MFRSRLRRRRARTRLFRAAQVAPLVIVFSLFPARSLERLPPPIHVSVEGSVRTLRPDITLGEVRRTLALRPRFGDLVDVEGIPLQKRKFKGHIEVNGVPAGLGVVLADGDVVEVVHAEDRSEHMAVRVVPVPEGQIPNPQTILGVTPGEQVITTGSLSGKLVSAIFRPTGAAQVPHAVALTFDDGPSPQYTLRILRILKRFDAKATFFMVGNLVERYPDIVRRVLRAGMAIGNHSLGHPNAPPFARLGSGELRTQVVGGHRRLDALGVSSQVFRPPGGSWDPAVLETASAVGERTVLWSVDTQDWRSPKPRFVVRGALKGAEPGSIILLHDGGGNRIPTIKALPRIIRGLRKMGLSLETL